MADRDKAEALPLIKQLWRAGYTIYATSGTERELAKLGVPVVRRLSKIGGAYPTVLDAIGEGWVDLIINTVTKGKAPESDGFNIRRKAVEHGCHYFTSLDTVTTFWRCLRFLNNTKRLLPRSLQEYISVDSDVSG